jgi:hypothetical protein
MKSAAGLFFFIAIAGMGQSQTIVTPEKSWSNVLFHYASMTLSTEHLRFTDDTVINSLQYMRVERSTDESFLHWSFYGYIREDGEKRIFYRTSALGTEKMLYDLDLEIGDSLEVSGLYNFDQNQFLDMKYFVTDVDSFQIGDGFRMQWHLSIKEGNNFIEVEQWIDSTGSRSGMLHNWDGMVGCDGFSLLCFSENEVLLYQNPAYTSCYVITAVYPHREKDSVFKIFPNPVRDKLTLELSDIPNNATIQLLGLTGHLWLTTSIPAGQRKAFMDVSTLPAGLYFLKVIKGGVKVIGVEKVVVE